MAAYRPPLQDRPGRGLENLPAQGFTLRKRFQWPVLFDANNVLGFEPPVPAAPW